MRRAQYALLGALVGGLILATASASAAPPQDPSPAKLRRAMGLEAVPVSESESFEVRDAIKKRELVVPNTTDEQKPAAREPAPGPVVNAIAATGLDDAQIIAVLHAAQRAEVRTARTALARGQSPLVQKLAARLIADAEPQDRALRRVTAALNLAPASSELADAIAAQAERDAQTLNNARVARFDHRFLERQRASNTKLDQLLRTKLLPAATTDAVRVLVGKQARRARQMASLSRALDHDLKH